MSEIILITGATELAKKGNHVIIHGRNEQKAKQTVAEIKQQAKQAQVEYLIADLFSLPAVKQIADKFQQKYDHLDVLINNAGAVLDEDRKSTRLNSSHVSISYAVFCLKKKRIKYLL